MSLPLCTTAKKEKVNSPIQQGESPIPTCSLSILPSYELLIIKQQLFIFCPDSCLQGKDGKVIRGMRECFIKVIITLPSAHHSQTASIMQTYPTQERPELRVSTWPEC